jgi:hypothetical protein
MSNLPNCNGIINDTHFVIEDTNAIITEINNATDITEKKNLLDELLNLQKTVNYYNGEGNLRDFLVKKEYIEPDEKIDFGKWKNIKNEFNCISEYVSEKYNEQKKIINNLNNGGKKKKSRTKRTKKTLKRNKRKTRKSKSRRMKKI